MKYSFLPVSGFTALLASFAAAAQMSSPPEPSNYAGAGIRSRPA
jgi:hypothetical protein